MTRCQKPCTLAYNPLERLKEKYSDYIMYAKGFLTFIVVTSLAVAFVSVYIHDIPRLLLGFLSVKHQLAVTSGALKYASIDTSLAPRRRQKIHIDPDVRKEAIMVLNVALDMQSQGKNDKALKLFKHALSIDPDHADILTAYGEFVEIIESDVLRADHMYKKALAANPDHRRALQNIMRTKPLVEEIDLMRFNRIDEKRSRLHQVPQNHPGLRRAKKEAYYAHIYHTNAIEGNTLTLAQTRVIVETRVAVGGKSLVEQNEVLGLDSALSYVNSTLVGRVGRLCLDDILAIHRRVLGHVDPISAGEIRKTQVYVGDFEPPRAVDVPSLLDQLVEWLNSEEALQLHPVEFAALAHYRLVVIHPFYDGNGRTSRLLMNLILMQAGFPPVSIEVENRLRYYDTLKLANDGDIRPFIRFIAECAEKTLDEYLMASVENPFSSIQPFKPPNNTQTERVIIIDNS